MHLNELRAAVRALPSPSSGGTVYYRLDALGSVRAVTDANSTVIRRHDYLPFGEEYEPEPGSDARRFTGKECDAETGLDYVGARYYASRTARFGAVDPVFDFEEALTDPQRWNRYAYAKNGPLRFTDPDGKIIFDWANFKRNVLLASKIGQSGYGYLLPAVAGVAAVGSVAQDALLFAVGGELVAAANAPKALPLIAGTAAGAGNIISGPFGNIARGELEGLARSGGPTVQLMTRLTQAPAAGRALSAAGGEGAEGLANAVRTGGQLYSAAVPQGLLNALARVGCSKLAGPP